MHPTKLPSKKMQVLNRAGKLEDVSFDKVLARISALADGLSVDSTLVAQKVLQGLYDGISTSEIDKFSAEVAAAMMVHPDYNKLAARITVSDLHRNTPDTFSGAMRQLGLFPDVPLEPFDALIVHERDFEYDYLGIKTLERSYLLRKGRIVERPQYMLMRVALYLNPDPGKTYEALSRGLYTHATPTLFNAGVAHAQLASCFLLANGTDVTGIYKTLGDCAEISRYAGGIGFSCSDTPNLVPMLRVFNETARHVDQAGKRKGSFAAYLEPWHEDVESFLDLKKNTGLEEARARDLFYGLWIPDLFMERVRDDREWTLFSPEEAPGLSDVHGEEFRALYETYEKGGRRIRAQDLWSKILTSQIETGTPYMMYKDACNAKSNQKNLGTIKCSNLCTEIVLYTSREETAVCNLASVALPKCVGAPGAQGSKFNFQALFEVTRLATYNLNRVIDRTYYPTPEARTSNTRHRPIGIGVQGLADVFLLLGMPFDSASARDLNREIFETMHYAALSASCDLAEKHGTYESYEGSPASKGLLQPDLWGVTPGDRWDWDHLRKRIASHGLRNSALIAPMPTASSSSILGNNECFEPYTSNLYVRRVLSGEFTMMNKHLVRVLESRGMWTEETRQTLLRDGGSVRNLEFPESGLFKTVWEIKQKVLLDMAIDRGAYVCHSQSMNVFLAEPNVAQLTSMHFYGWRGGLKTGMYYLRTNPKAKAIQVTCAECESCSA